MNRLENFFLTLILKKVIRSKLILALCLNMKYLHLCIAFIKNVIEQITLLLVAENLLHQLSQMLCVKSFENLVF